MTETVPLPVFVTYAFLLSGMVTACCGSSPTVTLFVCRNLHGVSAFGLRPHYSQKGFG